MRLLTFIVVLVALLMPGMGNARTSRTTQLRHDISWHRTQTWAWQDRAGVHRTRTEYAERHVIGLGYLHWQRHLWNERRVAARRFALAHPMPSVSGDWETVAVPFANRVFPGTSGWLLACSSSEGGHGLWVPNRRHSGAGGWMQFLSGTFYHNVDAAFAETRRRGFRIPSAARSWYSSTGQAVTAAYMYVRGWSGQWYGASC